MSACTFLRDLWAGLLDLVYPPKCLVCGDMQSKYLCEACMAEITYIEPPVCYQCGAPLAEGKCRDCSRGIEFSFNDAQAVGIYDGVLKDAIHAFKFGGHKMLGPILGAFLVDYLRKKADFIRGIGCIIPVPIHPLRQRDRGFNQSELLAREISNSFAIPLLNGVLARTRPTGPQARLPFEKRRENVADAYVVLRADAVDGRSVLLVDDVLTTGSTADAASLVLRAAGAREIHVLTLARSL